MGVLIQHCARKAFTLALSIPRSIRKMKIILLFLSTFSIMYWVQCAEYACPEYGVGIWTYDVDVVYDVIDWHDCGEICEAVSSCKFWTYETSDEGLYKNEDNITGARGCK